MNNLHKVYLTLNIKSGNIARHVQSNASLLENCIEVRNKNPRNLELMTIAKKPVGYHLDKPGHEYWHKLLITVTGRHVEATINHFKNGPVIKVSTKEWALKKQLYKTLNVNAFTNIGRLLAQRCLESGISAIYHYNDKQNNKRHNSLLEAIKESGVSLEEPPAYKHFNPWDAKRMPKPWVIE